MCGIAGIVDYAGRLGPERLQRIAGGMADALSHRGPDDGAVWLDPSGRCAISHRRLSVIDPRALGRQPMLSPDGRTVLSFNGEIYNYLELRPELERKGPAFVSESDSEVLLRLFDEPDPSRLSRLRGMYAFATWYPDTRTLLLARDPFGKKPLYVMQGSGWLAFASELSAVCAIADFEPRISREAVSAYLLLQYVPAPLAIYEGCEKLLPGSWMRLRFDDDGVKREQGRHFEFRARGREAPRAAGRSVSEAEVEARADDLLPLLVDAVSVRLRSDVPLGAFLSGGIDSALVVAMMRRELGVPVQSFSIGFANTSESEHEQARESALALGTQHFEQILEPDAITLLPEIAARLDEPLGDSSCLPTYLLSRFARENVTVCLSGDGGDELFGGYPRYQRVQDARPGRLGRLLTHMGLRRPFRAGELYCGPHWLMFCPDELRPLVDAGMAEVGDSMLADFVRGLDDESRPLVHRLRELDARSYMPGAVLTKLDRMSMAFALEVRSPFLDSRIAEFSSHLEPEYCLSAGIGKRILRTLSRRYFTPAHVARPKIGFSLPGTSWNHHRVVDMLEDAMLGPQSRTAALLSADGLRAYVERSRNAKAFHVFQAGTLLMLEHWLRSHDAKTGSALSA